jgi:hypothetical protein
MAARTAAPDNLLALFVHLLVNFVVSRRKLLFFGMDVELHEQL